MATLPKALFSGVICVVAYVRTGGWADGRRTGLKRRTTSFVRLDVAAEVEEPLLSVVIDVALTGRRRQVEKRPRRLKNYSLAVSKIW
ncbi:hypothetical protein F4803DRAFT_558211 [Xylaria telfairii]|nr:hypothetical protein F4803DRAFT_558211 [Xylaria telfairii]